jgi:glutathione S-transferase
MKLNGFGATRSLRALWGLKELDAGFEFEVVNLIAGDHRRPEFLRLNPAGKVPVLVDGDLVIPESAAIVLYLAEKYPQKKLLPADLQARASLSLGDVRSDRTRAAAVVHHPTQVLTSGREASAAGHHARARGFCPHGGCAQQDVWPSHCATAHR